MNSKERLKVITQIVEMESSLYAIKLPASGSIYYKRDVDVQVESIDIPGKGKAEISASDQTPITAGGTRNALFCS